MQLRVTEADIGITGHCATLPVGNCILFLKYIHRLMSLYNLLQTVCCLSLINAGLTRGSKCDSLSQPIRLCLQTIDYEGFRRFMYIYLDSADMPDDLYRHLFLSFIKRPSTSSAAGGEVGGRWNGDMAGMDAGSSVVQESPSRLHGLLHGLTERLHNLGGSVELAGRRSRAGK